MNLDIQALKGFIVKARRDCWLGGGQTAEPSLPGATRYVFEEGDFRYEDEYLGDERFQGREVVLYKGEEVWGMVYNGKVYTNKSTRSIDMEETYTFLKEALRELIDQARTGVSGALRFDGNSWFYEDNPRPRVDSKQIEDFSGVERIFVRDSLAYRCEYSGGLIR